MKNQNRKFVRRNSHRLVEGLDEYCVQTANIVSILFPPTSLSEYTYHQAGGRLLIVELSRNLGKLKTEKIPTGNGGKAGKT